MDPSAYFSVTILIDEHFKSTGCRDKLSRETLFSYDVMLLFPLKTCNYWLFK